MPSFNNCITCIDIGVKTQLSVLSVCLKISQLQYTMVMFGVSKFHNLPFLIIHIECKKGEKIMRGNWNPCWSKTQHQDKIKMSKGQKSAQKQLQRKIQIDRNRKWDSQCKIHIKFSFFQLNIFFIYEFLHAMKLKR